MNDKIKGVIYARYSSSGQRDESIEGQLRDCHAYAKANGITIIGEYCDKAKTGRTDKRPEFQKMIRDSAKGQFSVVICWKNDRFARSRYDSAHYKVRLKQNGVKVLYAKETIPETPDGIILESMLEGMAEYYSANLAQNVKRGNRESALKLQTLGQMVYGLKKGKDGRFEIDPETAPNVRRAYEMYAAGIPALEICKKLNDSGFRSVYGNPLTVNSLRNMLKNKKYIGVYDIAGVYDEHGIPAIIDKQTFDKVQGMLKLHHEKPAAKKMDDGFLLTGKLFCGECESPMTGDSAHGKCGKLYNYYTCVKRRKHLCQKERAPKAWIENVVVDALTDLVSDDEIIEEFARQAVEYQERQDVAPEKAALAQRKKDVERAINNSLHAIDNGLYSDSLKSHLLSLEQERDDLDAAIAKLEVKSVRLTRESVIGFLRRFRDGDRENVQYRMLLIDTFLRAAYLFDDGRLYLDLNFTGAKGKVSLSATKKAVDNGKAACSDFTPPGLPKGVKTNTLYLFGIHGVLVVCAKNPSH